MNTTWEVWVELRQGGWTRLPGDQDELFLVKKRAEEAARKEATYEGVSRVVVIERRAAAILGGPPPGRGQVKPHVTEA